MNITPSLPHLHTYLCSARFIVNITHQHDNDRNLQAIYCYACCLVGTPLSRWTVDAKFCDLCTNKYTIDGRAACDSRAADWPSL